MHKEAVQAIIKAIAVKMFGVPEIFNISWQKLINFECISFKDFFQEMVEDVWTQHSITLNKISPNLEEVRPDRCERGLLDGIDK